MEVIHPFMTFLVQLLPMSNNNKIKLISSDPSGVIFGNAFVLGQLLIQFSMKDTSVDAMSSTENKLYIFHTVIPLHLIRCI